MDTLQFVAILKRSDFNGYTFGEVGWLVNPAQ